MNFTAVLHELQLYPFSTPVEDWVKWAELWRLELPQPFLDALKQGAAELLTRHSNAEFFCAPVQERGIGVAELQPFQWEGSPIIPLLWENQGSFVYGLHLNGEPDPPVLVSHEFISLPSGAQPVNWQPFSANFNMFAFARLHDFQYLWNAPEGGWDDAWYEEIPFSSELEAALSQRFKLGPVTPEVFGGPDDRVRHRFYRASQRLSLNCGQAREAYCEFSAATEELYHGLRAEFRQLQEVHV